MKSITTKALLTTLLVVMCGLGFNSKANEKKNENTTAEVAVSCVTNQQAINYVSNLGYNPTGSVYWYENGDCDVFVTNPGIYKVHLIIVNCSVSSHQIPPAN